MDSTGLKQKQPQSLSTCSSERRGSYDSQKSPEFEFWMVRNPSVPQQDLISADELFVNGVLLPLDLLSLHQKEQEHEEERQPDTDACPVFEPGCKLSSVTTTDTTPLLTTSKRWTDIFKKNEKKNTSTDKNNDKDKRKEKKSQIGLSSTELNINIWPFSRSRSAGTRPSTAISSVGTTRKVSSAPCSRSNSAGESKSRKWPSSPSRPGVHLGRTSPVWQVRRGGISAEPDVVAKNGDKSSKKKRISKQRAKALNLKVPMCIGYRHQLSCRSDESSALGGVVGSAIHSGGESSFSLRSIFTKKVC